VTEGHGEERLTKAERDEVIDTGRHVYGCCTDDCPDNGLPEDAQIVAVERILAARTAALRDTVARVEAWAADPRNHSDWCWGVPNGVIPTIGECECHVASLRAALASPTVDEETGHE